MTTLKASNTVTHSEYGFAKDVPVFGEHSQSDDPKALEVIIDKPIKESTRANGKCLTTRKLTEARLAANDLLPRLPIAPQSALCLPSSCEAQNVQDVHFSQVPHHSPVEHCAMCRPALCEAQDLPLVKASTHLEAIQKPHLPSHLLGQFVCKHSATLFEVLAPAFQAFSTVRLALQQKLTSIFSKK